MRFLLPIAFLALSGADSVFAAPNPPPAGLTAGIERHLNTKPGQARYQCASLGFSPSAQGPSRPGFEDAQFDFTPAGFRIVIYPNAINVPETVQSRLRFFARQGLLESKRLANEAIEFTMNWKGFVASGENGCFYTVTGKPKARIISWERKQRDNIQVYEVAAQVSPGDYPSWTKSPEYAATFGYDAAKSLAPKTVMFDAVRDERGFTVITENGVPVHPGGRLDPTIMATNARRVGPIDAQKLKARLQSTLDEPTNSQARLCLPLPAQDESDENDFYRSVTSNGQVEPKRSAYFKFYNLLDASPAQRARILRGYEKMRRLETLGLARSELLPEREFRNAVATGAARFTLQGELIEQMLNSASRCLVVGKLVADAVLIFEPVEPFRESYRFAARLRAVPVGSLGEKAFAQYGHFKRMAEPGVGLRYFYRIGADGLRLSGGPLGTIAYAPDISGITLPVVATESRPAATPAERRSSVVPTDVTLLQVMAMSEISVDGLTMTYGGAGTHTTARSSVARGKGTWYAEATLKTRPGAKAPDTYTTVGVARLPRKDAEFVTGVPRAEAFNMRAISQPIYDGETIGIALDGDSGKVYFFRGGRWTSGSPDNPSAGVQIPRSTEYVVYAESSASSQTGLGHDAWTLNFGASPFKYPVPAGYLSWDARVGGPGVTAAAPAKTPAQPAAQGTTYPCRDAAGAVVYLNQPCAQAGMEQVGIVKATEKTPDGRVRSRDRIIWIDPETGGSQSIEILPENPSPPRR